MPETSAKDINVSIKTWNGLLEYKNGSLFEAQINFDEVDNSFVVFEIREIAATKEKIIYKQINPFEINIFSIIREMMKVVK